MGMIPFSYPMDWGENKIVRIFEVVKKGEPMEANTMHWRETETGGDLVFSPSFNAAVLFIDRHLQEGRSEKIAIRTLSEEITYSALAHQVNRFGNALLEQGLKPRERFLMVVKDCPEFCFLFWGAIKAGIVVIPLNVLQRAETFAQVIDDSQCRAVAYSPEYAKEVLPALDFCKQQDLLAFPVAGKASLKSNAKTASPALAPFPSSSEDVCFWLYSSGTTGLSKGIVHTHRALAATSQLIGANAFEMKEDDIYFSGSKLFFAYGLGFAMNFPLWMGGTTVLDDRRPTPQIVLDLMSQFRPTIFSAVPTFYAALLKALENRDTDFSYLRICCSAGEPLPADLMRRWQKKTQVPLLDGIGATESLSHYITNTPKDYKAACSGRVVKGYQAEIRNDAGERLPCGENGTLWIKSPSAAKEYWHQPKKTEETFVDGWVRTGDVFHQDEAGYFYYQGRNDDMIKVGGIFVSPFQIESALSEHPKILEAGVVGIPDENNLIKPKAWVVLNTPEDADASLEEELKQHCKDRLAPYMYPRWVVFIEELPKTATGKIRRFLLRQQG